MVVLLDVVIAVVLCSGYVSVLTCEEINIQDVFDKNGLIWTEENDGITFIKHIEVSAQTWRKRTHSHQPVNLARYDNANITHIAVDARNRTIVVSDRQTQQIKAVTMDRFGNRAYWNVSDGTSTKVNGIAIDDVTDIVYWTDAVYDVILAVSLFMPNMPEVIVDEEIDEPYGIATFSEKGFLFWTDIDEKHPRLMRSSLGGTDVQTLLSFEKGRRAFSLFLDHDKERLYWIHEVNSQAADEGDVLGITSCDIHGQSMEPLKRPITTRYYDVAIFAEQLIYIEGNNINVYKMDMPNRGTKTLLEAQPKTLTILSTKSNLNKPNPCNESLCPGLCTSSNTTVDCFCVTPITGRSHWHHQHYCRSKPYFGLMIPMADGIYTVKTNFVEYKRSKLSKIKLTQIVDSSTPIRAVATDTRGKKIFFYESGTNMIKSVETINRSVPEIVTLAVGKVGGIVLDWNTNNLYWTDIQYKHIMVSKEDGRFPVVLHSNLKNPKAIAIHPFQRLLFWSERMEDGKIMRSYLDGSEKKELLKRSAYIFVDIAVDIDRERLYLCSRNSLHETDLNGESLQTHYKRHRHWFTGVAVYHDYIVLSDTSYNTSGLHVLDHTRRVVGSLTYPDFHYGNWYGVKNHHRGLRADYEMEHGNCDQLTLAGKESVTCRCTLGYNSNGDSCEFVQMFVSWRSWQYVAVPVQAMRQPYSVAYDSVNKMVYWSDLDAGTISRALVNGSNQDIILYAHDAYFTDIVIDPGSRLLFYIKRLKPTYHYNYLEPIGSIIAYNIDTGVSIPIINRTLQNPYSLTVNVEHGAIFFTETTEVWRAYNLNETEIRLERIVSNVYCTVVTTTGSELYLTNEKSIHLTQVIRTDLFGQNLTVLFELEGGIVVDLKVDNGFIYWINGSTRGVQRMRLNDLSEIVDIGQQDLLFLPTSISVIPYDTYFESPCSRIDCDGVCLPTQPDGTCVEANVAQHKSHIEFDGSGHCRIPDIINGEIIINEIGRTVPSGYIARVTCYPAHTISNCEPITCTHGQWTHMPMCNLDYSICGNQHRGYKLFTTSGYFFAHPAATKVEVICIGGGGGGYDIMNKVIVADGKAGDGGTSKFGDFLKATGGDGGSAVEGGKGGFGHVSGGDGSIGSNCTRGGIAGQAGKGNLFSNELFCGAGGYSYECAGNLTSYGNRHQAGPGGTDGNWSTAGFFGGGAGSRQGGTGGGGSYARITLKLDEKSLINVTVGRPGFPSYGHAGPGLVVVMWGDYRIDEFVEKYDVKNQCVLGDN